MITCLTITFHDNDNKTLGEITFGDVENESDVEQLWLILENKCTDDFEFRGFKLKVNSIIGFERHNRCAKNRGMLFND